MNSVLASTIYTCACAHTRVVNIDKINYDRSVKHACRAQFE